MNIRSMTLGAFALSLSISPAYAAKQAHKKKQKYRIEHFSHTTEGIKTLAWLSVTSTAATAAVNLAFFTVGVAAGAIVHQNPAGGLLVGLPAGLLSYGSLRLAIFSARKMVNAFKKATSDKDYIKIPIAEPIYDDEDGDDVEDTDEDTESDEA